MKSREFKKIYHPKMGRYVYKHRGNGLIVDNIMKPLKKVASMLTSGVIKAFAKKALTASVSRAGEKVGKKAADKAIEKSGELIRKRLSQRGRKSEVPLEGAPTRKGRTTRRKAKTCKMSGNDVNTMINKLIARP